MYAFGGSDGFASEGKEAERKPRRNQSKKDDDDVQVMKF
jgi:hypothetical protein